MRILLGKRWLAVAFLIEALAIFCASSSWAQTPAAARKELVRKAQALEARGRQDMAIQVWRQILLSDSNNTEALAGLAKDAKQTGDTVQSKEALERLRAINPKDPNLARIEALGTTATERDQLQKAGDLARQGHSEEAMRIYRTLYGDHPPEGEIALAYCETLYGTAGGREAAVTALRGLAQRNADDARFAVELGVVLTYDAKTRAEGMQILQSHSQDPKAQAALRQALLWNAANPASAAALRLYLKDHPEEKELAASLRKMEARTAERNAGFARTAAEAQAFAALNENKLAEAERRFTALLARQPKNPRAAAGMGFLRMKQNRFGDAVKYFLQAKTNGFKERAVEDALSESTFWLTMQAASNAAGKLQFAEALRQYHAALVMRPRAPDALAGVAGVLAQQKQYQPAAQVYEQLVAVQPNSVAGWRGLFLATLHAGDNSKAELILERLPTAVKAAENRDLEFLRAWIALERAAGHTSEADQILQQALALPIPDEKASAASRLEAAALRIDAGRFEQAAVIYAHILKSDASNGAAWRGLVSALHQLSQDKQAVAEIEKMPPSTHQKLFADPDFLALFAAVEAQTGRLEEAQALLDRAVELEVPTLALELQWAGLLLQRGRATDACERYRSLLRTHPESADAGKGLILSLQATHQTEEAQRQLALLPPTVRAQLDAEVDFLEALARLYAESGQTAQALDQMHRVERYYAERSTQPPANLAIQIAWLLYDKELNRALYPALMRLEGRQDLTAAERESAENIWANWSVRTAEAAFAAGDRERAAAILDAAAAAFAEDPSRRRQLAGGYLQMGRARQALALYRDHPPTSIADFQPAIGAALAANDKAQADLWLRQAQTSSPNDGTVLALAAQLAQAKGETRRAEQLWKATLESAPPETRAILPENPQGHRVQIPVALELLLSPDAQQASSGTPPPASKRSLWSLVQREQRAPSPREEAALQLRSIESSDSGWLGGTGFLSYRSGDPGFNRLFALEAPIEATLPLGDRARFVLVAKPVSLDAGESNGASVIALTTLSGVNLGMQQQPLGTLLAYATPPTAQKASGIGGEAQLVYSNFALAGGVTPKGFLASTFTARLHWKPANGPITLDLSRDSVKDSALSWAGLHDPGTITATSLGTVWGGVVANQATLQLARGGALHGFYAGVGGQYLTGVKIESNTRMDGSAGAYGRVRTLPEYGELSIGANVFAMHYAHNENAFTYGMGGYFSPQLFLLANLPVTWNGHYKTRLHYNATGSFGVQYFQQNRTALFPAFTGQESLQSITVAAASYTNLALPSASSIGPNYDARAQAAYPLGPHWFVGGFFTANNARSYLNLSGGFSIRYLFRQQPSTVASPTGLFPSEGLRPFLVP